MLQVTVTVEGAEPLANRFQRFPEYYAHAVETNLVTLGHTVAYVMREHLKVKLYRGDLERSIQSVIDAGAQPELRVGPEAGHAGFVQYGTPPHWAPIEPLKAWAAWKLGDEKAAYRVQHAIAVRGTPAHDYIGMTLADGRFQAALVATAERLGVSLVAKLEAD